MRIISVATLKPFWEVPEYQDAEQPLRTWVRVVRAASWTDPPAIKRMLSSTEPAPLPTARILDEKAVEH